jgi:hypothetical protein
MNGAALRTPEVRLKLKIEEVAGRIIPVATKDEAVSLLTRGRVVAATCMPRCLRTPYSRASVHVPN